MKHNDFIVYLCPVCGRTERESMISTSSVEHRCSHLNEYGIPEIVVMVPVWPIPQEAKDADVAGSSRDD